MTTTGHPLLDLTIDNGEYATLADLSAAAGVAPEQALALLSPLVEQNLLVVEPVAGQFFLRVLSIPGRSSLTVNDWARIRSLESPDTAAQVWVLARDLKQAGWKVSCDPHAARKFSPVSNLTIQTRFTAQHVPVLPFLDRSTLPASLSALRANDAPLAALVCRNGELDQTISTTRQWFLQTGAESPAVLVLEAPSFSPTVVAPRESSLEPRSTLQRSASASESEPAT